MDDVVKEKHVFSYYPPEFSSYGPRNWTNKRQIKKRKTNRSWLACVSQFIWRQNSSPSRSLWSQKHYVLPKYNGQTGIRCLGGSVSWASDSWFWLRSQSQGCEIKPRVRLFTECGACLRFSLSLSLSAPPSLVCPLAVSLNNNNKKRQGHLGGSVG